MEGRRPILWKDWKRWRVWCRITGVMEGVPEQVTKPGLQVQHPCLFLLTIYPTLSLPSPTLPNCRIRWFSPGELPHDQHLNILCSPKKLSRSCPGLLWDIICQRPLAPLSNIAKVKVTQRRQTDRQTGMEREKLRERLEKNRANNIWEREKKLTASMK